MAVRVGCWHAVDRQSLRVLRAGCVAEGCGIVFSADRVNVAIWELEEALDEAREGAFSCGVQQRALAFGLECCPDWPIVFESVENRDDLICVPPLDGLWGVGGWRG